MTHRHFGLSNTTAHHLTPGQVRSGARHHAPPEAGRNSIPASAPGFDLVSGAISSVAWSRREETTKHLSLTADPPFPRSPFAQAVIDVTAVVFAFLFVSLTALAIVGAFFIAFFVSV